MVNNGKVHTFSEDSDEREDEKDPSACFCAAVDACNECYHVSKKENRGTSRTLSVKCTLEFDAPFGLCPVHFEHSDAHEEYHE
jgi:hypothetical protein